jgi:HEAT repeat protein
MGKTMLGSCTRSLLFLVAWVGASGSGSSAPAGSEPMTVVRCPDQSLSLEARWQWAMTQIPAHPPSAHVWIGFSTRRLMREDSFVGRWPVSPDYPTLSELVYGVRVELPRFSYSRRKVPREVAKEVAYLFEVERASGRIEQAQTSDISLSVHLMRGVLFWLGEVGQEQSTALFQSLYRRAEDDELRLRLVAHIAEARNDQALSFLEEVLQKEKSERVRRAAVRELTGYDSQKSLEILLRAVQQDSSDTVRRGAVQTIGRLELSTAEGALMEIAKAGPSPHVQREAIHVLGERTSPGVIACLGIIIKGQNQPRENQRAALEALAGMESAGALQGLIQVARTHADSRLRHEAIDHLRERESPEARDCLRSIIQGKEEPERTQAKALETLASIEDEKTLEMLIQVARTHERPSIRRRAIEELRRFGEDAANSPAVVSCLVSLINAKEELGEIRRTALDQLAEYGTKDAWDAIIRVAAGHADPRLREEAIDRLTSADQSGPDALPEVGACLVGILNNPGEQERMQRKALEALVQAHDEKARTILIRTAANHANPRMRREAIDELGPAEELDAKALAEVATCLQGIVDNPKELEAVQRRALDTLKDIRNPSILAYLKKTARSHPNRNIRREAEELVTQEMAESWNSRR